MMREMHKSMDSVYSKIEQIEIKKENTVYSSSSISYAMYMRRWY